jgi:hypothetical protein
MTMAGPNRPLQNKLFKSNKTVPVVYRVGSNGPALFYFLLKSIFTVLGLLLSRYHVIGSNSLRGAPWFARPHSSWLPRKKNGCIIDHKVLS